MTSRPKHSSASCCSRRSWFGAALAAAAWASGACRKRPAGSTADGPRHVIQNAGSDTIVNLAQAWAEKYATVEPSVSVEVSGGGSGTGIAALINGTVDVANSSRKIEEKEIESAIAHTGKRPTEFIVGYDALAVFVHPGNPLEQITIPQLAEIYGERGTATRWEHLGVNHSACRGGKIIRVSRQSNSGTYHYFREAVLGETGDLKLGSLDLHGSKDVVELIARTPCAIGYSGMGYTTTHVKALPVAKAPGEPAHPPTVEATQTGVYPIARPLYMYTAGEPTPLVKAFMDWILSPAGQQLVRENGFVPLASPGPAAEAQAG
jgi:phosphate transport system substrate-binding protein